MSAGDPSENEIVYVVPGTLLLTPEIGKVNVIGEHPCAFSGKVIPGEAG